MLRVYHVMPDHTAYSRLQMLHLLSTTLTATFVAVILFLNKRQCTAEAAIIAGVVAGCVASLPVVIGRALFKWANMHGRRRQAYKANKVTRHHVWIDGADAGKGFGGGGGIDRRGSEVSTFGGIAPSCGGASSMATERAATTRGVGAASSSSREAAERRGGGRRRRHRAPRASRSAPRGFRGAREQISGLVERFEAWRE